MKCPPAVAAVFRRTLAASLLLVSLAGCQSVTDGAKEWFSKANTCPLDRIETRERSDLTPGSLDPSHGPSAPPEEVAADPERLKMWHEQQAKLTGFHEAGHHLIEARGCGKHVVYDCRRPQTARGMSWWCDEVKVPDAFTKW